jgi:hypothetical protein
LRSIHEWTKAPEPRPKIHFFRIRNTGNGRCYVGSTFDLEYRFYMHRWNLDNASHRSEKMIRDWPEHRSEAITFEVVETGILEPMRFTSRAASDRRRVSERIQMGYNSAPEAKSSRGCIHTAEERLATAEATKRQFSKPEARRKTSIATRRAMAGPKLRHRLSESAKRKWRDPAYRDAVRLKRITGKSSPALAAAARDARKVREKARALRRGHIPKLKPTPIELRGPTAQYSWQTKYGIL